MVQYLINGNFDFLTVLFAFISLSVIAFIVFPARGFAQAYVADKLGDHSGRFAGRMTMNPLAHIDTFGIIALYIIGIGFIKPVPVNPSNFKKPRAHYALTLLAGPAVGLIMGFLGVAAFRICTIFVHSYTAVQLLSVIFIRMFAFTNISLAVFTLLPLPFLDGYMILSMFLPSKWVYTIRANATMISFGVMLLIFSGAFSYPISFLTHYVYRFFCLILGM